MAGCGARSCWKTMGHLAKDKYKAFYAQLSSLHSVQKDLCIVDEGLKDQLRVQIHSIVMDHLIAFIMRTFPVLNYFVVIKAFLGAGTE